MPGPPMALSVSCARIRYEYSGSSRSGTSSGCQSDVTCCWCTRLCMTRVASTWSRSVARRTAPVRGSADVARRRPGCARRSRRGPGPWPASAPGRARRARTRAGRRRAPPPRRRRGTVRRSSPDGLQPAASSSSRAAGDSTRTPARSSRASAARCIASIASSGQTAAGSVMRRHPLVSVVPRLRHASSSAFRRRRRSAKATAPAATSAATSAHTHARDVSAAGGAAGRSGRSAM